MSLERRDCCGTFPGQLHRPGCEQVGAPIAMTTPPLPGAYEAQAYREWVAEQNVVPAPDSPGLATVAGTILPTDAKARKAQPLARGLLDYFPAALAAVAELSRIGNEQHNPGEELHWARGKSTDQADCIVRHLIERGTFDTDGVRHSTKVAWRALALLQEELEADGARPGRASRFPE